MLHVSQHKINHRYETLGLQDHMMSLDQFILLSQALGLPSHASTADIECGDPW